ncbi:hypothetical protein M9979_07190 [Sphingomonas sp. RP10(2022)]|uniref:DUF4214 domain-containing protein n=1 Tax=Sphingomonas liriopis TaxID=2949094 RepID=A0A9X2HSI3_9SPHN|nr:hypothetical protein [Sphingomonas liriopis]MCP3734654.1 hypothetical protein [Sphingomonas liriopis]
MRMTLLAGASLIVASLGGISMPEVARAQGGIPQGSYLQTCSVMSIDSSSGELTASCEPKHECSFLAGCDLYLNTVTSLYYTDCVGDISNNDGNLYCTYDQAKVAARLKKEVDAKAAADSSAAAQAKAAADLKYQLEVAEQVAAATPGMRAAAVLILGRDLGSDEIRKLVMTARAPANPESRAAIFTKEFDFGAASAFLKRYIARSIGEPYRNAAVDAAFLQVYGRLSTPGEQIDYYNRISAGKAWYATIVNDQMPGIAPGSQVRAGIAQRVAQAALGRDPSLAELQQWTASGQNFGTMVEGVRQQLWGGGDADPLILTVQRALNTLGRPSDDAGVKAAVAAWRPMKATYSEMIGPVGKAKLGNGRPPSPVRG